MHWFGILAAAAVVWIVVSIPSAVLFAQAVAVADQRRPRTRRTGERPAGRISRFVSVATGSVPAIGPKLVSLATGAVPVIRHTD
jgi:hypothetical protein